MADFRKMLYALALLAVLATLTVPASAQGLICNNGGSTTQLLRKEGFEELMGDIVLTCTASAVGTPTAPNSPIPAATIRVQLSTPTTMTSKITQVATSTTDAFTEALLMIGEPQPAANTSATPPYYGQLYCGAGGNDANGVCNVFAPATPDMSYDGNPSAQGTAACTAGSLGCGRPNIFQGRYTASKPNEIYFSGIPLDPPGSNSTRTIRITNLRVNATVLPGDAGSASNVNVSLVFEGPASVSLQQNTFTLGFVRSAAVTTSVTSNSNFTVCTSTEDLSQSQKVVIVEAPGFESSWRPRNISQFLANQAPPVSTLYQYDGSPSSVLAAVDSAQNTPGVRIFSEGGFYNPGFGTEHGINTAGAASTGTQLTFQAGVAPTGVSVSWPTFAPIYLGTVGSSGAPPLKGFAQLVSAPTGGTNGPVTYEIAFADPFQRESVEITPTVTFSTPTSNGTMNVANAVLAPSGTAPGANFATIPLFNTSGGGATIPFVTIGTCNCSLLFPWIVSSGNFSSGIAVVNTSADPSNKPNTTTPLATGYTAAAQSGGVTLYLFGTDPAGANQVAASCSTVSGCTPGPTASNVAAGTGTTFTLSGVAGGFQGYAIAQATFQYCHGTALVFGIGSTSYSFAYLGLVMDHGTTLLPRTTQLQSDQLQN